MARLIAENSSVPRDSLFAFKMDARVTSRW
jgi:hypothetical protein